MWRKETLKEIMSRYSGEDAGPKRLQFITLFLSLVFVLAYIVKFGGFDPMNFWGLISSDPEDWAFLGDYVTGTVGVLVLIGTLDALVISINKQSKLVRQQDDLISQQKLQMEQVDHHQRKMSAYSRAEKFFPPLLETCLEDLDVDVFKRLREKGWVSYDAPCLPPETCLKDLFDNDFIPSDFKGSGNVYFSSLWGEFLHKPYSLAVLVAGCLEDAPELEAYLSSKLGSYREVLACVLVYFSFFDRHEVSWVCQVLRLPMDYSGLDMAQRKWQEIGREVIAKRG